MSRSPSSTLGPEQHDSVGWTEAHRAVVATPERPLPLVAGGQLDHVELEYECYGALNAAQDNLVLVLHALSGDAHAAGWDRQAEGTGRHWRARKPGWWDAMIGPGKYIDTDRFCIVCANVLGGCAGSSGPSSTDPATGRPYGMCFPLTQVEDWVAAQARLIDQLGVERIHTVIGGSLGGQQALEWALAYPERVGKCAILASAPRLSAQGLAFNAVGRHSIMNDPAFQNGDYYDSGVPATGLSVARMLAHITYLSDEGIHAKFGRRLQDKDKPDFDFGIEFQVESYLDYQGRSFVERFDANSYLHITRAMDYYDAAGRWGEGDLTRACRRIQAETMVVSFSTDWLYTPAEGRDFATAMARAGRPVTYINLPSPFGHDAFLVEIDQLGPLVRNFVQREVGA